MEIILMLFLYLLAGGLVGYGARFVPATSVIDRTTILLILRLLILYYFVVAVVTIVAKVEPPYVMQSILVGSVFVLDCIGFAWWFLLANHQFKDSPRKIIKLLCGKK